MNTLQSVSSGPDALTAPTLAVLLHGFGSNEQDLAGLGRVLNALPWVALRAPLEVGPGGFAWFPITTPGSPDAASVAAATDVLWQWIDTEVAAATRIVPIGFSQGGLMATQLLRTRPERVAATVVLGGFVHGAAQVADAELARTKPALFWGRGDADTVIARSAIERTLQWLPAHTTLTAPVYPGLGHGINAPEVADARAFLTQNVSVS